MPRYVVERIFSNGLRLPIDSVGIVERNADDGVTWLQSYVSDDATKSYCIYDAPNPEAIRKTAARNALPVERITQVRVLDPYVYA
jgi:uncharacterized protein DUF4242